MIWLEDEFDVKTNSSEGVFIDDDEEHIDENDIDTSCRGWRMNV
jgi:hypothetical protein